MSSDNKPITASNLSGRIADRLRDDVLSGRLGSGERISEKTLVERFGVSRTPIREALVQLSQEGILDSRPNYGVTVAPLATDEIRELVLPIRQTLEAYALRLVFDQLTAEDFRVWEDILKAMRESCKKKDLADTAEQDIAFHRSIIRRSGQPDVMAIWSVIVVRLRSHFWDANRRTDDLMDVYREHREIVDTFRDGDVEAAVKALTDSMTMGP